MARRHRDQVEKTEIGSQGDVFYSRLLLHLPPQKKAQELPKDLSNPVNFYGRMVRKKEERSDNTGVQVSRNLQKQFWFSIFLHSSTEAAVRGTTHNP